MCIVDRSQRNLQLAYLATETAGQEKGNNKKILIKTVNIEYILPTIHGDHYPLLRLMGIY